MIADFDVTEEMLRHFIQKVHQNRWAHPRVVVCVPSGVTGVEKRAVEEACLSAGARQAYLIEEPMAAAIGAGLPVGEPTGNMVVDIGGGTSEVAVISLGGIVVSQSIRVGGDELDEAIINYVKREYKLLIGQQTAEEVKLEIGSAYPLEEEVQAEIRGRDLVTGLPKTVVLTSEEVRAALEEPLVQIIDAIKETLDRTPPELASDIMDRGIMLAGGGSLLQGLDERLREETQMPAHRAESPLTCVAVGSGRSLEEFEAIHRSNRNNSRNRRRPAARTTTTSGQFRMYDKAVRRRRAVLAVLVALSLTLLTAYFGESAGGGLHGVQRGAMAVLTPIQEGANRAAQAVPRPVRLVRRHAGRQVRARQAQGASATRCAPGRQARPARARPEQALRGAGCNVAAGGEPERLRAGRGAHVRALADARSTRGSRSTRARGRRRARRPRGQRRGPRRQGHCPCPDGIVDRDAAHRPGLRRVRAGRPVRRAARVEAARRHARRPAARLRAQRRRSCAGRHDRHRGHDLERLPSLFPPGILIGIVSRVDIGEGELDRRIHVKPAADLRRLDTVAGADQARRRPPVASTK